MVERGIVSGRSVGAGRHDLQTRASKPVVKSECGGGLATGIAHRQVLLFSLTKTTHSIRTNQNEMK